MCIYPRLIKNPKYKENKKNGGVIPPMIDKRVGLIPIGCGECIDCKKKKAREWQYRIIEDIKTNKNGKFITLTFSNKSIKELSEEIDEKHKGYNRDNAIATIAVRRWLERWRKKHKKSVRHWLVTELGGNGTENIHLHGIVWTDEDDEEIRRTWQYGYVWTGKRQNEQKVNYVNERTAAYITKYMTKKDLKHKYYKAIVLTSAGIGRNYTDNKKKNDMSKDHYRTSTGNKTALNIYWRNKLYEEEEREKLWIKKLDENKRYIGKQVYDADDYEGIMSALKRRRELNKELGYNDGSIDWKEKEYEENLRELNNKKRGLAGAWGYGKKQA